MFFWKEDFETYDKNGEPYGLRIETCSAFTHKHCRILDDGFSLTCTGNKYILNTPVLGRFKFVMDFYMTYTDIVKPEFDIIIGYDESNRSGQSVNFAYTDKGFEIKPGEFDGISRNIKDCGITLSGLRYDEKSECHLELDIGDEISGIYNGYDFSLPLPEGRQPGAIAVTRNDFIGEMVLLGMSLESGEEVKKQELMSMSAQIPMLNGGNIPYKISTAIEKENEICSFTAELTGGTQFRHDYMPRLEKSGQYAVEQDYVENPYIRLIDNDKEIVKVYIKNGTLGLTDPGIQWKACLMDFLKLTELPISQKAYIKEPDNIKNLSIAFGYENFFARGFDAQEGGPAEFIFDIKGGLIYSGVPKGDDSFTVTSPHDKEAVRMVPDSCYKSDVAKKHFADNHYFSQYEDISFTLTIDTRKEQKYISVKAQLRSLYDDVIEELEADYRDGKYCVSHAPLDIGLYRIVFLAYYGESLLKECNHIFEVFDISGERLAAHESGLPFLYSMPNEQRYLDRDSFDPWNPLPSNDLEHLIACTCFTGVYAEQRRTWEAVKPFARKWFVYMAGRTMNDYDMHRHADIVKNADYIYYPIPFEIHPLRNDLWKLRAYKDGLLGVLSEFLRLHPNYAEKVDYNPGDKFTQQHLDRLHDECMRQWYDYANKRILDHTRERNAEIKNINPDYKCSSYGPFSLYTTPTISYYIIRAFGHVLDDSLVKEVITGFAQFEDYPYACCYHTWRGAFSAMTIHLHFPELRLYPEQYKGSRGGCIDGAVKFANPPLGEYHPPAYFQLTHAYEYVYNTVYKDGGGYHYWRDRGFMQRSFSQEIANTFVRGWKHVLAHEPAKPLRATAFITDYDSSDDRYEGGFIDKHDFPNIYNVSDEGIGYLYECTRMAGIPAGFALKWDSVTELTAADTDLIVLPSTINAPKPAIEHIRMLYDSGVSLVAVSDISGLEDIFGVAYCPEDVKISSIRTPEGDSEYVLPYNAQFLYRPDGADILLLADDMPAVMKKGRAILINASVSTLGRSYFMQNPTYGKESISKLLRNTCVSAVKDISAPAAESDGCGITLFRDERGDLMLLAIDYSDYNQKDSESIRTKSNIVLNIPGITGAKSVNGVPVNCLRGKDGNCEGLQVTLRIHEAGIILLEENLK